MRSSAVGGAKEGLLLGNLDLELLCKVKGTLAWQRERAALSAGGTECVMGVAFGSKFHVGNGRQG